MTEEIFKAALACLEANIPFVVYGAPGEQLRFFADPLADTTPSTMSAAAADTSFTIVPWADDLPSVTLTPRLDAKAAIAKALKELPLPESDESVDVTTTPEDVYLADVTALVERLGRVGGKVVVSRTESEESPLFTRHYFLNLTASIFSRDANAFRYLFFTRHTGAWAGATPELISSLEGGVFRTMALAGTIGTEEKRWDDKNRHEHAYVANYIERTLRDLGLSPIACGPTERDAGVVKHLCTTFECPTEITDIGEITEALHPTPAIAGYPVGRALREIARTERHSRRCYGGYLLLREPHRQQAWLALRCFNFAPGRVCRYAGGGILADSRAADEWLETTLKLQATKP